MVLAFPMQSYASTALAVDIVVQSLILLGLLAIAALVLLLVILSILTRRFRSKASDWDKAHQALLVRTEELKNQLTTKEPELSQPYAPPYQSLYTEAYATYQSVQSQFDAILAAKALTTAESLNAARTIFGAPRVLFNLAKWQAYASQIRKRFAKAEKDVQEIKRLEDEIAAVEPKEKEAVAKLRQLAQALEKKLDDEKRLPKAEETADLRRIVNQLDYINQILDSPQPLTKDQISNVYQSRLRADLDLAALQRRVADHRARLRSLGEKVDDLTYKIQGLQDSIAREERAGRAMPNLKAEMDKINARHQALCIYLDSGEYQIASREIIDLNYHFSQHETTLNEVLNVRRRATEIVADAQTELVLVNDWLSQLKAGFDPDLTQRQIKRVEDHLQKLPDLLKSDNPEIMHSLSSVSQDLAHTLRDLRGARETFQRIAEAYQRLSGPQFDTLNVRIDRISLDLNQVNSRYRDQLTPDLLKASQADLQSQRTTSLTQTVSKESESAPWGASIMAADRTFHQLAQICDRLEENFERANDDHRKATGALSDLHLQRLVYDCIQIGGECNDSQTTNEVNAFKARFDTLNALSLKVAADYPTIYDQTMRLHRDLEVWLEEYRMGQQTAEEQLYRLRADMIKFSEDLNLLIADSDSILDFQPKVLTCQNDMENWLKQVPNLARIAARPILEQCSIGNNIRERAREILELAHADQYTITKGQTGISAAVRNAFAAQSAAQQVMTKGITWNFSQWEQDRFLRQASHELNLAIERQRILNSKKLPPEEAWAELTNMNLSITKCQQQFTDIFNQLSSLIAELDRFDNEVNRMLQLDYQIIGTDPLRTQVEDLQKSARRAPDSAEALRRIKEALSLAESYRKSLR